MASMNFAQLLQHKPIIFFHLCTALAALVLGIFIMLRRKGSASHKALGWVWVALMGSTAVASGFIRDYNLPNLAGYTPIHLFTLMTATGLPYAIWQIRHGNVAAHRSAMRGMFFGGCVLAGVFTLVPGRFLGNLLWS